MGEEQKKMALKGLKIAQFGHERLEPLLPEYFQRHGKVRSDPLKLVGLTDIENNIVVG